MIATLVGALSIAAWRTISIISPGQVLSAVGSLAPLALGALVIASALAMQRLLLTNRTLASRREVAVVPADDFDPKTDSIQFNHALFANYAAAMVSESFDGHNTTFTANHDSNQTVTLQNVAPSSLSPSNFSFA